MVTCIDGHQLVDLLDKHLPSAFLRKKKEFQQIPSKLRRAFEGTLQTIALIAEEREPETAGHQQRVAELACAIAKEMGLSKEQIHAIYLAGLIHEIGKIFFPNEVLYVFKKDKHLTAFEWNIIKTHPRLGYDILKRIEFLQPIAKIVLQHHENLDGSGYPEGLRGGEIILEAKILSVAGVVEALTHNRPYRPALKMREALENISLNKGVLYEPNVVDAYLKLFTEKQFHFNYR